MIERVRGLRNGESPHAFAHLVLPSGKRPSGAWISEGWYLGRRGDTFTVQLTWRSGEWGMPSGYERSELPGAE